MILLRQRWENLNRRLTFQTWSYKLVCHRAPTRTVIGMDSTGRSPLPPPLPIAHCSPTFPARWLKARSSFRPRFPARLFSWPSRAWNVQLIVRNNLSVTPEIPHCPEDNDCLSWTFRMLRLPLRDNEFGFIREALASINSTQQGNFKASFDRSFLSSVFSSFFSDGITASWINGVCQCVSCVSIYFTVYSFRGKKGMGPSVKCDVFLSYPIEWMKRSLRSWF